MTKLFLTAVTLFLSTAVGVEGFRDERTKKTNLRSGKRSLGETCSVDLSKATGGSAEYSMSVALGQPDSYIKLTVNTAPFNGVYHAWCVDRGRGIGLSTYNADITSIYDPRLQPGGVYGTAVDKPQNLQYLAWLINNIHVGYEHKGSNCHHTVTMGDLQNAAWNIIDNGNSYATGATSGYGFPANICVAEQLAAKAIAEGGGYQLDCTDPNEQIPMIFIVDDSSSTIKKQVLMAEYFLSDIPDLIVIPPEPKTPEPTYECPAGSTQVDIDFSQFSKGQYVKALSSNLEVAAYGAQGNGYTPQNKARIFDSANPSGGDVDLGSPNYACANSGPGEGSGGRPGRAGENCEELGKLLIIQESKKAAPDDLWCGGKFTFTAKAGTEMTFLKIGVLDIDETDVTLDVANPIKFAGVGDNGYQVLTNPDPKVFVKSFDVAMPGSGAVAHLTICERPEGSDGGGPAGHCASALGYDFGLKMDSCQDTNGFVSFASAGFEINGDKSADISKLGQVKVECLAGNEARITTTYGGAVRVKGATGFEVYNLQAGVSMEGLSPPENSSGKPADISHIEFCFNGDLCPNDPNKDVPGVCGCGTADMDSDGDGVMDCNDKCPTDPTKTTSPGVCGCGVEDMDSDGDGVMDCLDVCPHDMHKITPGVCGCGNSELDTDGDGTPDCNDRCPSDPSKTVPGKCGCGVADTDSDGDGVMDCNDLCPGSAMKTMPGVCGCDMADTDSDGDGAPDCVDECKHDHAKVQPGACGCGTSDVDTDFDGVPDCLDGCANDRLKTEPGACGCGTPDTDTDGDGTPDCLDECVNDPAKTEPGTCGCGVSDADSDGDGTPDCEDQCIMDPKKTEPGMCGCGKPETDSDGDGTPDCLDLCPNDPDKIMPGTCGCGASDVDTDADGTSDCEDSCANDPLKTEPGLCGCGVQDWDTDFDGVMDCNDKCIGSSKSEPGICGCDMEDKDTDGDGVMDCQDKCSTDRNKADPGICGCGTPDVDTDGDGVMDCKDGCSADPDKTEPGVCGCGSPDVDSDNDGVMDCKDGCPSDINKVKPGVCGCGVSDIDSDGDGTPDCNDGCKHDAKKTEEGVCGCGVEDKDSDGDGTPDCKDGCKNDAKKTEPGVCGCGTPDTDSDGDGTPDCLDECPNDPKKTKAGACGCGTPETDSDGNGTPDCNDGCIFDATKDAPGVCGCGVPDVDSDGDGTMDCEDECPFDPTKTLPGTCGCGVEDKDSDGDGVMDCNDQCEGSDKTTPGVCGCDMADVDSDSDGVMDCHDQCPEDPRKAVPGTCGCGVSEMDSDGDGTPDCQDECPRDPTKTKAGSCGCGVPDTDTDGDGTPDCEDLCPNDAGMTEPGVCGCGVEDVDTDGDGVMDCEDVCYEDPDKVEPGTCGCGVSDVDTDGDGTPDCDDKCAEDPFKITPGMCGCGKPDTDTDGDGIPDCLDDVDDRTIDQPPNKGSGSGDPHFKTWTGDKYDYHGECDLVLVDNPSFNDNQGLRVHVRTTRVNYFSYIETIAVQIGEEVLEFANDVENFLINGKPVEQNKKHHKTHLGGFVVARGKNSLSIRVRDPGRASKAIHDIAKIDLIARKNGFPAVVVDGGNTHAFKGSLGLIGDWSSGKRMARDGVTEMNGTDATAFALEWQVRDTEPMLFKEARFPQFPTTCTAPAKRVDNRLGNSHMQKEAEKVCSHWKEDVEDCIFDVIATRDVMVAMEGHITA